MGGYVLTFLLCLLEKVACQSLQKALWIGLLPRRWGPEPNFVLEVDCGLVVSALLLSPGNCRWEELLELHIPEVRVQRSLDSKQES